MTLLIPGRSSNGSTIHQKQPPAKVAFSSCVVIYKTPFQINSVGVGTLENLSSTDVSIVSFCELFSFSSLTSTSCINFIILYIFGNCFNKGLYCLSNGELDFKKRSTDWITISARKK